MDVADRRDRHVVGGLHQREFRGRFDEPAGPHQCCSGNELIRGSRLTNAIGNEEPQGRFDRHGTGCDPTVAQALGQAFVGTFVFVPGPNVVPHLQRLTDGWLFECRGHDDYFTVAGMIAAVIRSDRCQRTPVK